MRHKEKAERCHCEHCRPGGTNDRKFQFLKAKAEQEMAAGRLDCLLCHGSAHYLGFFIYTPKFALKVGRQKPGMTYYALCDECIQLADKGDRVEKQLEAEYLAWAGTRSVVQ